MPFRGDFAMPITIIERRTMTLSTILLIILVLLLVGALPAWPHSREWGYGPTGGLGLVLVIILLIVLFRGAF